MIGNTHIFLTTTSVQTEKLHVITIAFLELLSQGKTPPEAWKILIEQEEGRWISGKKDLETLQEQSRLTIPVIEKKEEYKKFFAEVYTAYRHPTYLVLGNLDSIDESAQEGMLKILEEPPTNLTLVLYSYTRNTIKPTIASRSIIHTIPMQLVTQMLDSEHSARIKKLFPEHTLVIKELIQQKPTTLRTIDFTKVEREDISLWLWQLSYMIEILTQQNKLDAEQSFALINKIITAQKLNQSNVQKKMVVESMSC